MTTIQRQPSIGDVGLAGAVGGIGLGIATVAVRQRFFAGMPGLGGNVGATIAVGGFGGLAAAGASQVLGGNLASDIGVVAGAAALGGMMMSSGGRAAAGHGAALVGAIALGGVLARNLVD